MAQRTQIEVPVVAINDDGVLDGYYVEGKYKILGSSTTIDLEDLSDYARGHIIRGGATAWEAYDASTDGAALIGDGTDIISDLTPSWAGVHTFEAGATFQNDITLDDGVGASPRAAFVGGSFDDTIEIGLNDDALIPGASDLSIYLCSAGDDQSELIIRDSGDVAQIAISSNARLQFLGGTSGDNRIVFTDNTANALDFEDAGGIEYLSFISTDAQPITRFNDAGADIDFYVEAVGVADAFFVQGSDGQVTIGALGVGVVTTDASGVLDSGTAIDFNVTLDDGAGDSPTLGFVGGSNDDTAYLFLADDVTASDSNFVMRLCDDVGDSQFVIQNASGVGVFTVSSLGDAAVGNVTVLDDRRFYLGTDLDTSIFYDEAGSDTTTVEGADWTWRPDIYLDDGTGDSPAIHFIGGTNDDEAIVFLADDAVAGDSNLVIRLCDAAGDSLLVIQDSGGTGQVTISSDGDIGVLNTRYIGITGNERLQFNAAGEIAVVGADINLPSGLGITHDDGNNLGYILRGDGTRYVPFDASAILVSPVAQGDMIIADATPAWSVLTLGAAAGYALVTTAVTAEWDQTPTWTGVHTFDAGWQSNGEGHMNGEILWLDADDDTGIASIGDDDVGISVGGNKKLGVDATDISVVAADFSITRCGCGIIHDDGNTDGEILRADGTRYIPSGWYLDGTAGQTYTFPSSSATLLNGTGSANRVAYWSGATTLTSDAGLTYNAATDSLTAGDYFTTDGGQFGISGNELLTVNAAGNFTFSGVTSIIIPNFCWLGVNSDISWLYDDTNNDITTQAKVGVKVADPTYDLECDGEIAVNPTGATAILRILTSDAEYGALYSTNGSDDLKLRASDSGGKLILQAGGNNDYFTIDESGNAGLGTTTPFSGFAFSASPGLHIYGTAPGLAFTDSAGGDDWVIFAKDDGTLNVRSDTDATEYLTIDTDGNIGLNNGAPDAHLMIGNNNANEKIVIAGQNSQTYGSELLFQDSDTNQPYGNGMSICYNSTANELVFWDNYDGGGGEHGKELLNIERDSGIIIINESSQSTADFRVEGGANENLILADASTDRVGINEASPAGKLHIDQSSSTGAQPVLFLDQADISEQCIQFSSDGVDRDINLFTVDVTGTPTFAWDESLSAFEIDIDTSYGGLSIKGGAKLIYFGYAGEDGPHGLDFNNGEGVLYYRTDQNTFKFEDSSANSLFEIDVDDGIVVVNESSQSTADFRVEGGANENLILADASTDRVGINEASPAGKLHINQSVEAPATPIPVLLLQQADVDKEFIYFRGDAASGNVTRNLVDFGDQSTLTSRAWAKVYVQDDGGQIAENNLYIRLYELT